MKRNALALIVVGALMSGVNVYAHHSFSGTYDKTKVVRLDGKLIRMLYRNPHSFIHIAVPDDKGQVQEWSIEWQGGVQLAGASITRTTLKVGDPLIVTANPSRTPGELRAVMVSLKRTTDGFAWGEKAGQVVD